MALIRAKDTQPEMRVRRAFHETGLRYRLHVRDLPGTPDLVFPSRKVALFVHGCFWHGHEGCVGSRLPKSREDFWIPKLLANTARDYEQRRALARLGWKVIVVWECETKDKARLRKIARFIGRAPRIK